MEHRKALQAMQGDETICVVCGGWLGRKPGTKPYCTARGCPGVTAAKDLPKKSRTERELDDMRAKRAADAASPASKGLFTNAARDKQEEMRIKRQPYAEVPRDVEGGQGASDEDDSSSGAHTLLLLAAGAIGVLLLARLPVPKSWNFGETTAAELCAEVLPILYVSVLPLLSLLRMCLTRATASSDAPSADAVSAGDAAAQSRGGPAGGKRGLGGRVLRRVSMAVRADVRLMGAVRGRGVLLGVAACCFGCLNVLALFVLLANTLLEPVLPQPGEPPRKWAVCLDWAALPPVRFDSSQVVAGPCLSVDVSFVGGAPTAVPVAAPAAVP
jgi:hypothetical protein